MCIANLKETPEKMAKWGEGDPRWIVEERPDATNVNNWHWTEKNATPWSKERITSLFKNFQIKHDSKVNCSVVQVDKIDGEATANNRKGKLIFFYEWNVVLKWEGSLDEDERTYKGKVTIPNLSEENDLDDIDITISIDESNDESERLKQFMYNIGRSQIRAQIGVYLRELREEFSKGLILPKKDDPKVKPDGVSNITSGFNKKVNLLPINSGGDKSSGTPSIGCKLDVKTITLNETFQCTAKDLYDALTKQEMVSIFTRSSAKVDATRGGEFVIFNGNITGKFEELVPNEKIVQTWRYKQWPSGHYSHVTINFIQKVGSDAQIVYFSILTLLFVFLSLSVNFLGRSHGLKSYTNWCSRQ